MSRLTDREQAVWDKRNAGLTFKKIAEDLGLCVQTVSFAYRKAYRKIEYGNAMKISKLTEYELLGSIEDIKSIHKVNQRCEKILETSLMVSQNNRLLSHELEVCKRALELAEQTIRMICPPIAIGGIVPEHFNDTKDSEYFLDQARKELEDGSN